MNFLNIVRIPAVLFLAGYYRYLDCGDCLNGFARIKLMLQSIIFSLYESPTRKLRRRSQRFRWFGDFEKFTIGFFTSDFL